MIKHQTQYGHTIIMPSELYFSLSDAQLEEIEQKYINANVREISYGGPSHTELDDIIDGEEKEFRLLD